MTGIPASMQLEINTTIYLCTLVEMIIGPPFLKNLFCSWGLFIDFEMWLKTLNGSKLSYLCRRCYCCWFQNENHLYELPSLQKGFFCGGGFKIISAGACEIHSHNNRGRQNFGATVKLGKVFSENPTVLKFQTGHGSNTIEQMKRMLWTNEFSRHLSLR